jgi:outer membrane protein OmpA-like peptidoglycan-associated protein
METIKIRKKMKKLSVLTIAVIFATMLHAQEKGFYLFGGGQVGLTRFNYTLQEGTRPGSLGYGGGIGIQYFFTYNVGLSFGFNCQKFNTKSVYSSRLFEFPNQVDDEGDPNTLRIKLLNWTETQKTSFIDMPLMVTLQKKFGREELHGFYFGAGFKLQIPAKSTYERTAGEVNISAYYSEDDLPLGDGQNSVELPQHNLGTNSNRFWSGTSQLKTGLAITGEAGFLFGLSRRVDLRVGVMADYGLISIQKGQQELLSPTGIQQEGSFIADKVNYTGVLNSNQANNIHPISVQGYLGLRIKLGDLKDLAAQNGEKYERFGGDHQPDTIYIVSKRDTIIVQIPDNYLAEKANASSKQEESPTRPDAIPMWYILEPNDNLSDSQSLEKMQAKTQTIIEQMEGAIYFDLAKHELKTEAIKVLDKKIALMKKYPAIQIALVAHTCDLGSDELNDQLSKNRAEMARFYMISRGINSRRLIVMPMGKRLPSHPNTDEYNRSRNRSVDFIVVE